MELDSETVFNRNERRQKHKKRYNFKNAQRVDYIIEKKERQRQMQRRRDRFGGDSPFEASEEEGTDAPFLQSTRCKVVVPVTKRPEEGEQFSRR